MFEDVWGFQAACTWNLHRSWQAGGRDSEGSEGRGLCGGTAAQPNPPACGGPCCALLCCHRYRAVTGTSFRHVVLSCALYVVTSCMPVLQVPPLLFNLVFGESVLNE